MPPPPTILEAFAKPILDLDTGQMCRLKVCMYQVWAHLNQLIQVDTPPILGWRKSNLVSH